VDVPLPEGSSIDETIEPAPGTTIEQIFGDCSSEPCNFLMDQDHTSTVLLCGS